MRSDVAGKMQTTTTAATAIRTTRAAAAAATTTATICPAWPGAQSLASGTG